MRFRLRPHSPFRLDLTAWALRRRPRNLIDRWDGTRYSRILLIDGSPLHLVVRQTAPSSRPEIECICACLHRAPKPERVSAAVERLLGLNVNMTGFRRLARRDAHLRALVGRFAGFHPPRFATVFEAAVNAMCCQQLSLEAGLELLNRLSSRTGTRFKDAGESLFGPPEPGKVARLPLGELRALGFSHKKAKALLELAWTLGQQSDGFEDLSTIDDQSAISRLMELKGIGRWSAEYILLRGLGRLNVFPRDDIAAAKNLRQWLGIRPEREPFGYDQIRVVLKKWHPFEGLVYFHLLLASVARRGWVDSPAPLAVDLGTPSINGLAPNIRASTSTVLTSF
jgi:DNA-3-methyladenine glycosylase II